MVYNAISFVVASTQIYYISKFIFNNEGRIRKLEINANFITKERSYKFSYYKNIFYFFWFNKFRNSS